jgi:hypothetical protein
VKKLFVLIYLVITIGILPSVFAETFSSFTNGDWNSAATWRDSDNNPGVPGPGDDKFIGSHTVTISSPVSNSGLVQIGGTLIVDSTLTNTGFVNNDGTFGIINFGIVNFTSNAIVHNNGLYENFGGMTTMSSGSQFNNNCASNNAHFHNEEGNVFVHGTLTNTGDIHQLTNGIMNVTGTLDNSSACGIINNYAGSILDNTGNSIINDGTINVWFSAHLVNNANSLIDNNIAGKIVLEGGKLTNEEMGTIENTGTIDNNSLGILINEGTIVNDGTITSESEIKNLYRGLVEQNNIFTNENGGVVNNFGELNVTSTLTNNAGGTIDNKFDEPNEFGNIYLSMNLTNNGILNDCGIITNPHKIFPTKAILCDMDGDFLLDSWETHGIDFDHDKTIDLTLSGADHEHKDLYLEIDYMEHHKPKDATIAQVVTAFANAPQALVNNPDGQMGISLHIEVDEQIPHQDEVNDWIGFDPLKKTWFGTPSQRGDEAELEAKKYTYRYGMIIHNRTGTGSSGLGELPGNDFIVSLGSFDEVAGHGTGTDDQQAATIMHEMGHTLGLGHGGQDDFNCKPNYLSIMSYTFQFDWNVPGRPLDYSREANPTLTENNLNETAGVVGPAGRQTILGTEFNLPNARVATNTPVNFDRDGNPNPEPSVSANINWIGNGCEGVGTVLTGFSDWDNIEYDFRTEQDFSSDGAPHPEKGDNQEMTYDQLVAMALSINPVACLVPETGDWTISEDCTLVSDSIAPGNVNVQNNSTLTISPGVTLDMDFVNQYLHIEFGSGVLIQSGGTLG